MSTQPKPFLSPEQYLAIERAADHRSEYFDGEMFAMSGGTFNHAKIASNLHIQLGSQLRGRICGILGSDMRLRVDPDGPYFYPDIVVFCGQPQFEDPVRDTLKDATVIIEVLSPSTERYDRTFKFEHYKQLPSFTDYMLVAQDRVYVERKTRRADGSWHTIESSDPNAVIELMSIGCNFRVSDVYERVEFS